MPTAPAVKSTNPTIDFNVQDPNAEWDIVLPISEPSGLRGHPEPADCLYFIGSLHARPETLLP